MRARVFPRLLLCLLSTALLPACLSSNDLPSASATVDGGDLPDDPEDAAHDDAGTAADAGEHDGHHAAMDAGADARPMDANTQGDSETGTVDGPPDDPPDDDPMHPEGGSPEAGTDAGVWQLETVADEVPEIYSATIAAAVDTQNGIHAAFAVRSGEQAWVTYAKRKVDGSWTTPRKVADLVPNAALPSVSVSIAVDAELRPHVFYNHVYDEDGFVSELVMAVQNDPAHDGAFEAQVLDGDTGVGFAYETAAVVDPSGMLHLAYLATNSTGFSALYYARHRDSDANWNYSPAIPYSEQRKLERELNMVVGSDHRPHIVYRDATQMTIKYATLIGPIENYEWDRDSVVHDIKYDPLERASISINGEGHPTIAFASFSHRAVGTATLDPPAWPNTTLGPYESGESTWTAVGYPAGTVVLTYYDPGAKQIHLVRAKGAGYDDQPVEHERGAGYPGNTVFDAEGRPHVLYFDPLNHRVREASADLAAL